MEEILATLLNMEIIGKIAGLVLVTVQGLKVFHIIETDDQISKAAILTALIGGIGLATAELYPPSAPFIGMFFVFYVGAMVAGLGYKYLAGPFFEKLGLPMSTKSLK